jgi:hypothetical protein
MGYLPILLFAAYLYVLVVVFFLTKAAGYHAASRYISRVCFPGAPGPGTGVAWLAAGLDLVAVPIVLLFCNTYGQGFPALLLLAYIVLCAARGAAWWAFLRRAHGSGAVRDVPHWAWVHSVAGVVWSALLDLLVAAIFLGLSLGLSPLLWSWLR